MDGQAPSTGFAPRQIVGVGHLFGRGAMLASAERLLETEREQLPLWIPVMLGLGIAAWFALPQRADWMALICASLGLGVLALGAGRGEGRLLRILGLAALLAAGGCLLAWGRAGLVGEPPLARPAMVTMTATVLEVEPLPARQISRIIVEPVARPDLPRRIRLNLADEAARQGPAIARGMTIRLRARLMPPAPASLPGGYDFARRAWFDGLGATGRVLPPMTIIAAPAAGGDTLQQRLSRHVTGQLDGPAGAIAATLASGDRGHIPPEDEEAMRRSGLAHLLSISGVHVTAVVGAVVLLTWRLLALFPALALRWPLMLVAAAAGAGAGVGYTLLTGAEVPTIRACVAALLVMAALALGRRAISLRVVAAGALLILLLWPEALVGPSFQLSFAAVASIVALVEHRTMRAFFAAREESRLRRAGRFIVGLLVTGLAVEVALMPIALYHFHLTGMLGALANMVAIPLTEFVIMPAVALALVLDLAGLGAPVWWIAGQALDLLLWIAHVVAAQDSAILLRPAIPAAAFTLVMAGLLWLLLWRTALRYAGLPLMAIGLAGYATAPKPDILVTDDGRHVAVRTPDGGLALLRDRAGDYVREQMAELAGWEGEATALAALPGARCSPEFCRLRVGEGVGAATLLMARGQLMVPWRDLIAACAGADIVIAERTLPEACRPRWIKLDRRELRRSGGAAIVLEGRRLIRSRDAHDEHPWVVRRRAPYPRAATGAGAPPPQ